jgi:mannose-1-phosphate guanylyltransferase
MHSEDGLQAMVLAAGIGSRLDPLTRQVPKPMIPFANRPVMEHIVGLLRRHGITRTVSNLQYLPQAVQNYFGDGSSFGMEMHFVKEQQLTGDAGGLRACRSFLKNETFIVVMGDLITDMDLSYVIDQHRTKGAKATIALKQVVDVERFGVAVLDKNGLVTGFQEKPTREEAKSNLASTGIYVFEPEVFDFLGDAPVVGFGKDVFPRLVASGLPVLGVEVWGYWSDIGTVDQYRQSTVDALEGLVDLEFGGTRFDNGWLGQGTSLATRVIVDGMVLVGRESYVSDRVRINGFAVIGDNCLIDSGVLIQDSIIWPGTIIGANSSICGAVVGGNCLIKPNSHIANKQVVEPIISAAERNRTISDRTCELMLADIAAALNDGHELDADIR